MDDQALIRRHGGEFDIVLERARPLGHHECFHLQIFDEFRAVAIDVDEKEGHVFGRSVSLGGSRFAFDDFFHQVINGLNGIATRTDQVAPVADIFYGKDALAGDFALRNRKSLDAHGFEEVFEDGFSGGFHLPYVPQNAGAAK